MDVLPPLPDLDTQQRPRAYPRRALPHVYLSGPTEQDPTVAVPRHFSREQVAAAYSRLCAALEDGTAAWPGPDCAWTVEEPREYVDAVGEVTTDAPTGRWVRLLTAHQEEQSARRSGLPEPDHTRPALYPDPIPRVPLQVHRKRRVGRSRRLNRARGWDALPTSCRTQLEELEARQALERAHLEELEDHQGWVGAAARGAQARWRRERTELVAVLQVQAAWEALAAGVAAAASSNCLEYASSNTSPPSPQGLPEPSRVKNCQTGRWVTFQCHTTSCRHRTAFWAGCHDLDCARCAKSVTTQRAQRVWQSTNRLAGSWGWHVLTVPPEARAAVGQADPRQLRRAAWRAVQAFWRARGWEVGAVVYVHPVGSLVGCPAGHGEPRKPSVSGDGEGRCSECNRRLETVADGRDWHPHLNVGVPLTGRELATGRPAVVRRWVEKEALGHLQRLWLAELVELGASVERLPVCHYEYRSGPAHVRHALRYYARAFPGWARWTETRGGTRFGLLGNRSWAEWAAAVVDAGRLLPQPNHVHQCERCDGEMELMPVGHLTTWSATGPPGSEHGRREGSAHTHHGGPST